MLTIPVKQLIPVLQVAISPVIVISGVGLLLLSLTNRFGRAIDRSRQLGHEMRETAEAERPRLAEQIQILYRRAEVIRVSIIMGVLSVLLAAILIIVLFLSVLMTLEVGLVIALLFIACMLCLIVCLGAFIRDIQLSLRALKLEIRGGGGVDP